MPRNIRELKYATPERKVPTKFVRDIIGWPQKKAIGATRGLDRAVESALTTGFWTSEVEERTRRMVDSFGILYAENYLQAANKLREQPQEAQDALYDISLRAYKRLKRTAGRFFLLSYPKMMELGFDPDKYLGVAEGAMESGGSLYASKFVRYLPLVLEAGGNVGEYGATSLTIRNEGSFKMSSLFMSLAPEMATEAQGAMYDYADRVKDSIAVLGPELTSWAMPAYVYLQHRAGQSSERTQQDIENIRNEYGQKAAQWYSAGLRRVGNDFPSDHPLDQSFQIRWRRERGVRLGTQPSTIETMDQFRSSFKDVLNGLGITAASFFARTFEFDNPAVYKDAMFYTQRIVGKQNFDRALWGVIRSNNGAWTQEDVWVAWMEFNGLVRLYRKYSPEHFPDLINYIIKTAANRSRTARGNYGWDLPGSTSNTFFERYPEMYPVYHHPWNHVEHTHEGETALYNRSCLYNESTSGKDASGKHLFP